MADQITIFSIPLLLWKQIIVRWYKRLAVLNLRTPKYNEALLRPFFALKNVSKQLNQQFDDNFFLETICKYKLRGVKSVYIRKRIYHIIEYGSYSQLEAFLLLGKKYGVIPSIFNVLQESLPLVAECSDPAFMRSFLKTEVRVYSKNIKPNFDIRVIITAIRCANERSDNEMTLALLSHLRPDCRNSKSSTNDRLKEALKAGKKLNFDNVIGFDEMFAREPTDDMLLALIEGQSRAMKLVFPEGNLLRLNCVPSKHYFNREMCNFYMKKSPQGSRRTIVYRNRDNTAHYEILINFKALDGKSIIYSYEDKATDNLYELILKTSLFEKMFGEYPRHFVAVTKEALILPLEEQPWFFGNISEADVLAFASEAPNTSIFFTYSRAGEVYMTWTKTVSSKRKFKAEVVTDVAKLFPKDKFVLGLYNDAKRKGLAEHYAVKYVLEGNFEKARELIVDNNMDCKMLFDNPNILSVYFENTPKEKINDEMIVWLIEHGAPLEKSPHMDRNNTLLDAFKKCQEKTLKVMIQRLGCTAGTLNAIFNRRPSYDLLKLCYNSTPYNAIAINDTITNFLTAVNDKKVKINTYIKRTIIMMAWKYGNSENYFKSLPLEIVDQILSYEDIDEPAYYDMLLFLLRLKKCEASPLKTIQYWHVDHVVLFVPFMWMYWSEFNSNIALELLKNISTTLPEHLMGDKYGPILRHWFKRILTSDRFKMKLDLDLLALSPMTRYCLDSPTEEALSMLKLILSRKITNKLRLLTAYNFSGSRYCPATWLAVYNGYLPTIQYLLDEDLLPENMPDVVTVPKKLSDVYKQDPKLQYVKEFIEGYREKNKKKM